MPSAKSFLSWAESLAKVSYYGVLRIPENSDESEIKEAFRQLALRCHPDRFVDDEPEVGVAAAEVFKRGVEAYNILIKPQLRARYDDELKKGNLRMDPDAVQQEELPPQRLLEQIATEPRAQAFCQKADRLILTGKLDDARIQLINAVQSEPNNDELQQRLQLLYVALSLEPD